MCRHDCLYAPDAPIRKLLLRAAELDVRRYFRPPGELVLNGREVHVSELDWLLRFKEGTLRDIDIAKFLAICRLRCFLQFGDLANLLLMLRDWREQHGNISLTNRVTRFREVMFFPSNESSCVSKLSLFANPHATIFIWDSHAKTAASRTWAGTSKQ